ncbi:hypothetical protein M409DRAFT_21475 [Zasmidium cellare ATCC 36951]|uniref:Chromo domain-containing protein n=1 Tax=Zasmidium cellare ATCC 36951 TaxID=1080233 RepID=A0A6A6CQH8_ZASCE|nr:uncharacterized protein M409DRAFT_21475 [Zasmidium cellare ATCC 36951]KAF2168029.1 hypothetical protein M409DRAFT_21475 [Zasmidium cellare ATCC 36951]
MSRKGKARAPFAYDSDEDSIATDSTAESEPLDEYGVERILLEKGTEGGDKQYLIKWEGYPLGRSTWEPAGNIFDESIIKSWKQEQRRVRQGDEEPFDEDDWCAAVEEIHHTKEDHRRRRKAKRRRRGIAVSSDSDGNNKNEDDEHTDNADQSIFVEKRTRSPEDDAPVKARKRIPQPEVRRKGLAQKVDRRRRTVDSASSDNSDGEVSPAKSPGDDSLFDEITSKAKHSQKEIPTRRSTRARPAAGEVASGEDSEDELALPKRVQRKKQDAPAKATSARAAPAEAPAKATSPRPAPSEAPSRQPSSVVPPQPVQPSVAPRRSSLAAPSNATPSAPKARPTRQPDKVFGNGDAEKSRKQRPRVSGATPKDSANPQFRNLSTQHRFQQYSKNERAPDPNVLSIIDPKTGKKIPPASAVEVSSTGAVHSAYSRRTPPPEKPPEPPAPEPVQTIGTAPPPDPTPAPVSHASTTHPEKWETCWYWTRGICKYTDETCRKAHYHTGVDGGNKQLTCYYWKVRGRCNKRDEDCLHAHYDTGHYAPKPPDSYAPVDTNGAPDRPHVQSDIPPRIANRAAIEPRPKEISKKDTTCYYWREKGYCTKPDDVCAFAHLDTGVYAGPPGTFKRGLTYSDRTTNANFVPLAIRDNVAPHSARSPDVTASERVNAGLKLQTAGQTARPGSGSPGDFTASPMHMGGASPHDQTQQTPQGNILGAAMQRRPSVPKFSMKATLVLLLQEEAQEENINVKLDIDDLPAFKNLAGSDPILRIDQMVTAADFEHVLWQDGLRESPCSTGGLFVDTAQAASVENITDVCKTHVAGLIATPDGRDSKMLIYPGNAEEWKFFDREREHSSECVLRFRLFEELPIPPLDGPTTETEQVDKRPPAQILGEHVVKLDSEILFPTKELKKHPVRAVFLMIPLDHHAELVVLKEYFAALKCKVYHSGQAGSWDYFRTRFSGSCALIVHPDIQLWRIPGLYGFLASAGAGVRMFSIGVNPTVAMLEERDAEFTCDRLFPHGMVVFITDDAFINDPEQATSVINAFIDAHRTKPQGGETSRIAARPGILEWVLDLAMENTAERGRQDNRWMLLYNAMCKLSRLDVKDEDLDDDSELEEDPLFLISLSPELLSELEDLKESGDQSAATDLAVDWFAGWSLVHACRFRKFVVCHEPRFGVDEAISGSMPDADPRGWGRKYQHLGVVRARDALQMLTKRKEPDRRPPPTPK